MKKFILIRGLPGSGKSTLARHICDNMYTNTPSVHLETDMYFMVDGVYQFDRSKLGQNHSRCKEDTRLELGRHSNVVVVSNTFTTLAELRPYFEIGQEFGLVPEVIHTQSNFGSIHNVPDDVYVNMSKRFQYDISLLYKEFK
jgi:tRNA uridine 5-carbamoylmethylation protein Kti12